jgi:hypothetical protein
VKAIYFLNKDPAWKGLEKMSCDVVEAVTAVCVARK